jgi:cell division protein FtsL
MYFLLINELNALEKMLITVLIALLLSLAFFIKNSKYTLLIRTFDLNFIEVKVHKRYREDIKKITKMVNTRIKQLM